jgi:hypothetical protein
MLRVHFVHVVQVSLAKSTVEAGHERHNVASYRQELEKRFDNGIPSLEEVEPGKIVGAVLPMSEQAQTQMRESIEVIDYLLNQERVVWS